MADRPCDVCNSHGPHLPSSALYAPAEYQAMHVAMHDLWRTVLQSVQPIFERILRCL